MGETAVMEWFFSDRQPNEVRETRSLSGPHANPTRQQMAQGYEFQHPAVLRNVPPPTIAFAEPLGWFSLDRAERRALTMRLRDQLQKAILQLDTSVNRRT